PADFCARDGGEKFVVLLANTDRDAATVIAERIRGRVLALQISHAGSTAGVVTVSIGTSTVMPHQGDRSTLFDAADAAIYEAKTARVQPCRVGDRAKRR
ncbi:MAG: GGDEF domain-containing protein, partial [Vicinamibacteraceae bacterium]